MHAALVVFLLAVIFFLTAVISVVTGGTSLITVPVMMQCGIDAHVAVATNMLALIFLSLGGTVPFIQGQVIPRKRLPALTGLTLAGSFLGAFFLLAVPSKDMPIVVASAMLVVLIFSLIKRDMGLSKAPNSSSRSLEITGYIATFALGVYGGFFSGGYVALLTVAYVVFFRMTFTEAVAITKVLNFFSSLIATAIFACQGIVDWKLGLLLSAVSFAGAVLGATLARRLNDLWLRRIFLTTVVVLALKLFCDAARASN